MSAKKKVVKSKVKTHRTQVVKNKVVRTRITQPEVYIENDAVLPMIQLPAVTAITVRISAKTVELVVGPKDWSWDRKTKKLIGAGTLVTPAEDTVEEEMASGDQVGQADEPSSLTLEEFGKQ